MRESCGLLCNFDGCKELQESRVMNDRIKHGPEKEKIQDSVHPCFVDMSGSIHEAE